MSGLGAGDWSWSRSRAHMTGVMCRVKPVEPPSLTQAEKSKCRRGLRERQGLEVRASSHLLLSQQVILWIQHPFPSLADTEQSRAPGAQAVPESRAGFRFPKKWQKGSYGSPGLNLSPGFIICAVPPLLMEGLSYHHTVA